MIELRERAVPCPDCGAHPVTHVPRTWTWNTNGRCDRHQPDADEQEQRPT